jgi:hypothetical protein
MAHAGLYSASAVRSRRKSPFRGALHALALLAALGFAPRVAAQDAETVDTAFSAASRAESEGDAERAYRLYERVLELGPRSRLAVRARMRRDFLEGEAEGDWTSYAVVTRLRLMPTVTLTAADLDRIGAEVRPLPDSGPGREARIWLVDAVLQRGSAPDALRMAKEALASGAWSGEQRMRLLRLAAQAAQKLGSGEEAEELLRGAGEGGAAMLGDLEGKRRRAQIHWASLTVLGAAMLVLGVLASLGWRRSGLKLANPELFLASLIPGVGGVILVGAREEEALPVMALWAVGLTVLMALAQGAALGARATAEARRRSTRVLGAAAAAAAVAAWTLTVGSWENSNFGWF